MYIIGGYLAAANIPAVPTGDLSSGGVACMFFFYLWTAFYAVSWNGTPWVVNSEAFPGAVRQVTQCLAASSNWLCEFLSILLSTLPADPSLSLYRELRYLPRHSHHVPPNGQPRLRSLPLLCDDASFVDPLHRPPLT